MSEPAAKICLVIATLGAGGAERVLSLLATEWVQRGQQVTIITLGPSEGDHYPLPPQVHRIGLDVLKPSVGKIDALQNNFRRLRRLREAIRAEKPDVVISFMDATNILTLLATRGVSVPVIVSERIDPRHYPIASGWDMLRKKLYPRALAVVVQTETVAEWARTFIAANKVVVIPNPVVSPGSAAGHRHENTVPELAGIQKPYILAIGRLDMQKGFDLLLQAYAGIAISSPPNLVILGEGPERKVLTSQISDLNLSERVVMPGRVSDPQPYIAGAQLFVLSSRFEGFPNALLEAMSAGLPVISFDCPSGPAEIIIDGENGVLVEPEDVRMLSDAMTRLLADAALRTRLGSAAARSVERFSLENVVDQWDQLIRQHQVYRGRAN